MADATRSFDEQARSFDQRAGLPASVCESIAKEVARLAQLSPYDVLLEVGAGTGQIGHSLCGLALRYVGFDSSATMLEVFALRCRESGRRASLIHADGNHSWPAEDGNVNAVFSSRAMHLLPVQHVVAEVLRVTSSEGAALVLGRVLRQEQSLRARLRQKMRDCLRQCGFAASEGQKKEREILDACFRFGATPLERRIVATWPVQQSASQVLDSWREKSGLAGLEVPAGVKENILSQLAVWAKDAYGSLEANHCAEEKYVLEGVRLPSKP